MASATVFLDASGLTVSTFQNRLGWIPNSGGYLDLGSLLSGSGGNIYLQSLRIPRSGAAGSTEIRLGNSPTQTAVSDNQDFTTEMEDHGSITLIASDGTSVTFNGPNVTGNIVTDDTERYNYTAPIAQRNAQRVWATHVNGLTDKSITATFDDNQNAAPVVTIQSDESIVNGNGVVNLSGTATDPDTTPDTLALALTASPNIGTFSAITVNGNDWESTWTAPAPGVQRNVVLKMTATEPDESLTGDDSVGVTVRQNLAPTVTASADQMTVDVGETVNLTGTASDPEGEAVTHTWQSDIGGTLATPTALTTTWIAPSVTESTVVTFTFTATDGIQSRSVTVTVIVRAPSTLPLTLPSVSDVSYATGDIVNLELPAATQGLTPYIYSADGLPRGLTFRNRAVVGRPDLPGTYTVTYTVTDSNQDMVSRTFDITITGMAIPQPTGLNVRIDWGGLFYANVHSSVYSRIVGGIECFRGKNTASAVLGRSQAGTMSFELENDDGLYDDENTRLRSRGTHPARSPSPVAHRRHPAMDRRAGCHTHDDQTGRQLHCKGDCTRHPLSDARRSGKRRIAHG